MMNRSFFRVSALLLCLTMLCIVAAGCQPRTIDPIDATTAATTSTVATTVTRPTVNLEDATGSVFIGTWNVSAKTSHVSSVTFAEDGTVKMVLDGNKLAGAFFVDNESEMTLNVSGNDMKATYVVDGDTITITTENDVWTLTKPE